MWIDHKLFVAFCHRLLLPAQSRQLIPEVRPLTAPCLPNPTARGRKSTLGRSHKRRDTTVSRRLPQPRPEAVFTARTYATRPDLAHRAMRSSSADVAAECLVACLSLGCGELPLRLLVERDVGGGEVLLQVRHRGGAGYQQDVGVRPTARRRLAMARPAAGTAERLPVPTGTPRGTPTQVSIASCCRPSVPGGWPDRPGSEGGSRSPGSFLACKSPV
jgi:hypothetical protein